VYIGLWWGNLRERDHLADLGIDARIMLKWVLRGGVGGLNWNDVAQYRYGWQTDVNTVMNLLVP